MSSEQYLTKKKVTNTIVRSRGDELLSNDRWMFVFTKGRIVLMLFLLLCYILTIARSASEIYHPPSNIGGPPFHIYEQLNLPDYLAITGIHAFFFTIGWIFFLSKLSHDVDRLFSIQIIFSSTFALSCSMFVLLLAEVMNILQPHTRWLNWRINLTFLLFFIVLLLPIGIIRELLPRSFRIQYRIVTLVLLYGGFLYILLYFRSPIAISADYSATLSRFSVEYIVSRLAIIGVTSIAILSGYGAVNMPGQHVSYFMKEFTSSDIVLVEQKWAHIINKISSIKSKLMQYNLILYQQALLRAKQESQHNMFGSDDDHHHIHQQAGSELGNQLEPSLISSFPTAMAPKLQLSQPQQQQQQQWNYSNEQPISVYSHQQQPHQRFQEPNIIVPTTTNTLDYGDSLDNSNDPHDYFLLHERILGDISAIPLATPQNHAQFLRLPTATAPSHHPYSPMSSLSSTPTLSPSPSISYSMLDAVAIKRQNNPSNIPDVHLGESRHPDHPSHTPPTLHGAMAPGYLASAHARTGSPQLSSQHLDHPSHTRYDQISSMSLLHNPKYHRTLPVAKATAEAIQSAWWTWPQTTREVYYKCKYILRTGVQIILACFQRDDDVFYLRQHQRVTTQLRSQHKHHEVCTVSLSDEFQIPPESILTNYTQRSPGMAPMSSMDSGAGYYRHQQQQPSSSYPSTTTNIAGSSSGKRDRFQAILTTPSSVIQRKYDRLQSDLYVYMDVQRKISQDVHQLYSEKQRLLTSQTTLKGRIQNFWGYIMVIYCLVKVMLCMKNVLFGKSTGSDPTTRFFELFLANFFDIHLDLRYYSSYLSFIMLGILVSTQMRSFLIHLTKIFRSLGSIMTIHLMLFALTFVMAIYFVSMVLLLRMHLPIGFRRVITQVLGNIEFNYYHKWFDVIFAISSLITMGMIYVLKKMQLHQHSLEYTASIPNIFQSQAR